MDLFFLDIYIVLCLLLHNSRRLRHEGRSSGGFVLPVGLELALLAVVASKAVNSRFDKNEAELGVLVLAVALKVLAHGYGLLDEEVKVLGKFGGKACRKQTHKPINLHSAIPKSQRESSTHARCHSNTIALGVFSILTVLLEEAKDLVASHTLDLGYTIGISQDYANLGRGEALLGKLADMVFNVCIKINVSQQKFWCL